MGLFDKLKKSGPADTPSPSDAAAPRTLPPPPTTAPTVVMPWALDADECYRFAENLQKIVAAQSGSKTFGPSTWGHADVVVRIVPRGATAELVVLDQPWSGALVAVVADFQYPYLRPVVDAACQSHGVANVRARLNVLDTFYTVTLGHELAGPMNAYTIQTQVDRICDDWAERSEDEVGEADFLDSAGTLRIQRRPYGWRMFDAGWFDDDTEQAKWLAKELRKVGYKATVGSEGGNPGVKITSFEPK